MLSLFLLLAFSVQADEFDYNTAWQDVLDITVPKVEDLPEPDLTPSDPALPGTIFDEDSGASAWVLFPEDVTSGLVTYNLAYYVKDQLITSYTKSGDNSFNWSSISSPAYSFRMPDEDEYASPPAKVTFTVTQGSDFIGYLMSTGDTYDVEISGLRFNFYNEVYSSSDDEVPTEKEYTLPNGSYSNLYSVTGIDASGVERDIAEYVDNVNVTVAGMGTSTKVLNITFRVKSIPWNITSFSVTPIRLDMGDWGIPHTKFHGTAADLNFWRIRSGFRNGNVSFTWVNTEQVAIDSIEKNTSDTATNTKGIWDVLVNLPGNILDGLMGLFVPDDNFYIENQQRFEDLFRSRLGFIYQSVDILMDIWNRIKAVTGEDDTIQVPYLSYTFNDGTVFEFGGWEVDLIPDGLEILQAISRSITTMILGIWMLNYGINYFDKVKRL